MYILISNDDGVQAPGIQALRDAMRTLGETIIVAPDREQSATSHSLTFHQPIRATHLDSETIAVSGTPTDSVMLALRSLLDRQPDILVSGINRGPNLADDVTYSGTVAAAMESTLLGVPAIAFSLASYESENYQVAADFAATLVKQVLEHGLPQDVLLNVNIPAVDAGEIRGVRITRLGKRTYQNPVVKKEDPRGRNYYWLAGTPVNTDLGTDTDTYAIENDYISITPIHLDLTHYETISHIREWEVNLWQNRT
ncbi:MAG: 5'/3'-nucleotidase SurE [Gemmatimonadetes bacterium]|nr:MAG: 5'/3'-nucleotidase SurE [Gemmatimonadota bacterium]